MTQERDKWSLDPVGQKREETRQRWWKGDPVSENVMETTGDKVGLSSILRNRRLLSYREDRCGFYSGWRSLPGSPVWWQHPCQTNSLLKAISWQVGPRAYLWNGWDQSHWRILSAWNGACLFTPRHSWFMRGPPWSKYGKKELLLLIRWKRGHFDFRQ